MIPLLLFSSSSSSSPSFLSPSFFHVLVSLVRAASKARVCTITTPQMVFLLCEAGSLACNSCSLQIHLLLARVLFCRKGEREREGARYREDLPWRQRAEKVGGIVGITAKYRRENRQRKHADGEAQFGSRAQAGNEADRNGELEGVVDKLRRRWKGNKAGLDSYRREEGRRSWGCITRAKGRGGGIERRRIVIVGARGSEYGNKSWEGRPGEAERRLSRHTGRREGSSRGRRWGGDTDGPGKSERGVKKKEEGGRVWIGITFATFVTS